MGQDVKGALIGLRQEKVLTRKRGMEEESRNGCKAAKKGNLRLV